ncbi:hypothetical protein TK33_12150 [Staphylococcus aureus]|nr:hypothetical protein [Staphylococcus aureus]
MFSTLFHVTKRTTRDYRYQPFFQKFDHKPAPFFIITKQKKKLSNLCCLTPLYYPYFTIIHISLNYLMLASIFSIFLPSMTSLMRCGCNFLLSSNV